MRSLNILYLIQQGYLLATQASSTPSLAGAQSALFTVVQYTEWTSAISAALFLIFFIYLRLRLETVEHKHHHERHEAELEFLGHEHAPQGNLRWERVMELAHSEEESDWRRAILEADIMLGDMLDEKGYGGADIGEKLRSVNKEQYPSTDAAWEAHRLRNTIAHMGEGFELTHRDALAAIDNYRRAFEEFGYL